MEKYLRPSLLFAVGASINGMDLRFGNDYYENTGDNSSNVEGARLKRSRGDECTERYQRPMHIGGINSGGVASSEL